MDENQWHILYTPSLLLFQSIASGRRCYCEGSVLRGRNLFFVIFDNVLHFYEPICKNMVKLNVFVIFLILAFYFHFNVNIS